MTDMPMSPLVLEALRQVRLLRAEYDLYLETVYEQAADACRDVLLSREGREAGVSSWSLFYGPADRAMRYASEELREWWRTHPRVTFEDYERAYARSLYSGQPDGLWGTPP